MAEVRLIDANALDALEDLKYIYHPVCDGDAWYRAEDVWKCIGEQPTIDPESLRPIGRWVIEKRHTVSRNPYMDDTYHAHATCSECNFCIHSENASFGYPELNTTNYCPNCGAKMEG